jgi:hypothetical protein
MRLGATLAVIVALASATTASAHHNIKHNYRVARYIVYATFPDSTQHRALGVVGCETGGIYNKGATNRSSGTRGYFQVHPGNDDRVIKWVGHGSITIDKDRLYDPWYNSKVALYMSKGGTDWHEWAPICRR